MPGCGSAVIEFSVWCFEHRPTYSSGISVPDDLSGPTRVERYTTGLVGRLVWEVEGELSRTDGPAMVSFDLLGVVVHLEWKLNGVTHRVGGPAVVRLVARGWIESYYRDGVLDREEGPASNRFYTEGGSLAGVTYAAGSRGKHRLDGPAVTLWGPDGTVVEEKWFAEDTELPGAAEMALYTEARGSGVPHEWAHAFALGTAG